MTDVEGKPTEDLVPAYPEGAEITNEHGFRYKRINGDWVCQNPEHRPDETQLA